MRLKDKYIDFLILNYSKTSVKHSTSFEEMLIQTFWKCKYKLSNTVLEQNPWQKLLQPNDPITNYLLYKYYYICG